jgi:hypothetical protein
VVKCWHGHLKVGDACPASLCGGRLYDLMEPTSLLQFTEWWDIRDKGNRIELKFRWRDPNMQVITPLRLTSEQLASLKQSDYLS